MPTENRSSNTEMAAGLLPCPFCGGINLHIEAYSVQPDNYHGARVQCMDCEFDAPCGITLKDGGWSSNPEDAKADAATVWNTRVQPAAQHQGEPVAYAVFAANGNIRIWSTNCEAVGIKVMQEEGKQAVPLYLHPPTSDDFSAGDMADQGAKAFREGVKSSADLIQKRMDDYLNEFGAIDPETGSVEMPRGGDEYVGELQEIIEAVRALPMPQ